MTEIKKCFYDKDQTIIQFELHFLDGRFHNENGPAYRAWWKNGKPRSEQYYLNDVLHNENGPAQKEWWRNGELCVEKYFLNGKEVTKKQLENRAKRNML